MGDKCVYKFPYIVTNASDGGSTSFETLEAALKFVEMFDFSKYVYVLYKGEVVG